MREEGGTLWVHKATHHFDLLNWWLHSDPGEVFAYGDLEHYGSNGLFRGDKCRTCPHKTECKYYWDITQSEDMKLYVENEEHDGYIQVGSERGGHGGGDKRLHDKIFANPDAPDPLKHSAGLRDGVMSVLVGIAARKSIESNRPVKIADLSSIKPSADRT